MKDRTVILVTHHVDIIIGRCAYVVQLDEGSIAAQGTPEELRCKGLLSALKEAAQKEKATGEPLAVIEADGDRPTDENRPARKLVDKEDKAELVKTLYLCSGYLFIHSVLFLQR
jgi:ABC-type multidrug transport system ATPase subunit